MTTNDQRQVQLGEGLLDDMAKQRSAQTGESYAKAYAEVLQTPEGRHVHAAMHVHGAESERGAVAKRASASSSDALAKAQTAEQALDAMAERHAAAHGMDFSKAYDQVVRTGEGRRLYFEYCEAVEAAGR